jgi:HprK-related kinase A
LIVAELAPADLESCLRHAGLRLRTGPVVTEVRSPLAALRQDLALHYAQHTVEPDSGFADFHVSVRSTGSLPSWSGGRVMFDCDGARPFAPRRADHGFELLEGGLDWCLTNHCHQYLIVHAAVLARGDRALLLPAPTGAGKSTLCAGLVYGGGWRLLSDNLALVAPASGQVLPLARPIRLKGHSIDVIRGFAPSTAFGVETRHTTSGGRVVFASPPAQSVLDSQSSARPTWLVVPRYDPGVGTRLDPHSRARAFMSLVDNAFNYDVHDRAGFATLAKVVDQCRCHDLTYNSLPEAIDALDCLAASDA